jgi:hypothetical protein
LKVNSIFGLGSSTRRAIWTAEYLGRCTGVERDPDGHLHAQSFDHSPNVPSLTCMLRVVLNDAHQANSSFDVWIVVRVDNPI